MPCRWRSSARMLARKVSLDCSSSRPICGHWAPWPVNTITTLGVCAVLRFDGVETLSTTPLLAMANAR